MWLVHTWFISSPDLCYPSKSINKWNVSNRIFFLNYSYSQPWPKGSSSCTTSWKDWQIIMRHRSPCLSKELQLAHLSAAPRRTSDSNYRGSFSTGVGTESEEVPLHFELKMPIKLKFPRWPPMSLSQTGIGASVSTTDSAWRGKIVKQQTSKSAIHCAQM